MNTKPKQTYTIVVFGIHKDGRPRAAAYLAGQKAEAEKAASAWKLRIGFARSDGALALAKDLPKGDVFPSSKFDAPTIKRETYNLLCKALTPEPEDSPPSKSPSSSPVEGPPVAIAQDLWSEIKEGSIVLAQSSDPEEGYFLCLVVGISKDKKRLSLRWVQWPKMPLHTVAREDVGLLKGPK